MKKLRTVLVSEVALDPRNGAGMRAVLPYFKNLEKLTSLYILDTGYPPQVQNVEYLRVPYLDQPGKRLKSMILGARRILLKFQEPAHFIVLTNSMRDVFLGLICRFFSRKESKFTVWVMDDFMEGRRSGRGMKNWIYAKLFYWLYRDADKRVVVSRPCADYYEKIYGKKADAVLGRTLFRTVPPKEIDDWNKLGDQGKIRIVYVGSFLIYYFEPIQILKRIASRFSIPIQLDLYGMHAPSDDWLLPGVIEYKGSLQEEKLLETLNQYDFGLIPYSFNATTEQMMKLSFPSKLIDYLGASLPVLVFSPESLTFLSEVSSRTIGKVETRLTEESMMNAIDELANTSSGTYKNWQRSAQLWAREDFMMDQKRIDEILY